MCRVGQTNKLGQKLLGYNVYLAEEGSDMSFLGRATSLRAARRLAAHGAQGLDASLWDTARVAGHCAGMSAPEGIEDDEPAEWFGRGGWYCAVRVWDR